MNRTVTLVLALSALTLTACTKKDDPPVRKQPENPFKGAEQVQPAAREGAPPVATAKTAAKRHAAKPQLAGSAEARFRSAVQIVRARKGSYVQAAEMLKTVPASSPRYREAQAYLEWIRADGMVRSATRCYHRGQIRRAFSLLKEASKLEALGPSALASIKQRQVLWGRVIRSTHRGEKLYSEGKQKEAAIHLRYVVKLERNRRNTFRAKARKLLRKIAS